MALLFYLLLALAALTSLISLHEVSTAFLQEECRISRPKAATFVTVSCLIIGAFCSLSLGACPSLTFFGRPLFELFDFVTGQLFLPIGGFLTCIFIGWVAPRKLVRDEFTNWGTLKGSLFGVFIFLVRFVCPVSILLIFLPQFEII